MPGPLPVDDDEGPEAADTALQLPAPIADV
jgi:hypothetical protein